MSFSDVSSATNHFSTAYEGFTTTTSGTVASGATSVGLNSVAGLTNGSVFVGVIEPAGTKEQVFTGVVDTSGSQITSVVWTKGTNVDHSTGVTVVDYDSGTHHNLMTKGIKVEHLQSGAHGAITPTSVTSSGAITGTSLSAGSGAITGGSLVNATHTHANAAGGGQIANSGISGVGTEKLANPYKFLVYSSATMNIASDGVMAFDTREYDTGSNVNITTNKGRFTAPIAGFYHFDAVGYIQSLTGQAWLDLLKNGTTVKQGPIIPSAAGVNVAVGLSVTVQLAANDYIEIGGGNSQGTRNWTGGSVNSWFSGFLVSAT